MCHESNFIQEEKLNYDQCQLVSDSDQFPLPVTHSRNILVDPLSFEHVITLWQAHFTRGNQVERTSKVVKELAVFLLGGGYCPWH